MYMHTYVYTHSLQLKIIQIILEIIKMNLKVYIKYQIYFLKGN